MNRRIIDFHHHLLEDEQYGEKLIIQMKKLGIEKCCVSGLGIGKNSSLKWDLEKFNLAPLTPDNNDVLKLFKQYPDLIIPIGVIRLGIDTEKTVQELFDLGFKGLKITRPKKDYNDTEYFPIYKKAEDLNLPILFHTGFILNTPFDAEDDVCCDRMRPIKLDRIARNFQNLNIVIAHMGFPWLEEASALLRYHSNVYADLSGSMLGWRNRLSPSDFQKIFYWNNAYDKIIFGTDVHEKDMEESLSSQEKLFSLINLPEEIKEKIFFKNASTLFKF